MAESDLSCKLDDALLKSQQLWPDLHRTSPARAPGRKEVQMKKMKSFEFWTKVCQVGYVILQVFWLAGHAAELVLSVL